MESRRKRAYKTVDKNFKGQKTVDRFKKHGLKYDRDTAADVHMYGWNAAKRIQKKVGSQKMSRLKAEKIELGKQVAGMAAFYMVGKVGANIVDRKVKNKI